MRVYLTPARLQLEAHINFLILPNLLWCFFINMPTIVYFLTFICRPKNRYMYFGFIALVFNFRVHNNSEPCVLILRLVVFEARGWHRPHERSAVRIWVEILPCFHRLEGVPLRRNSLNTKEIFVFWGEVIQFLLIKSRKAETMILIISLLLLLVILLQCGRWVGGVSGESIRTLKEVV